MKNNGHGKAAVISDTDYAKIRACIRSKKYKLLLDLARYTGERWGCLIQLKISDVFVAGEPLNEITFRARTRKASTDGKRLTRQVPCHPQLKELLAGHRYKPDEEFLFPSPGWSDQPISLRSADLIFRGAVSEAGLSHKGYSTHSTRRTFITRLWEKGIDIHTIQLITGHQNTSSLVRYVESNPDQILKAISIL